MHSEPIPVLRLVFLAGFMGCGKTTVGRQLARRLQWAFTDLDEFIEEQQRRTISQIFAEEGEAAFRRHEHTALGMTLETIKNQEQRPTVIALGGGTLVQPANVDLIRSSHGITVWLHCPLEELRRRCRNINNRPLFRDAAQFEQLYRQRLPFYQQTDFRVDASHRDPSTVVEEILKCVPV